MIDAEPRRTSRLFLIMEFFSIKLLNLQLRFNKLWNIFLNKIYHFVLYYVDAFLTKWLQATKQYQYDE